MFLSPGKTVQGGPYKSIDGFDQTAIRCKITKWYTIRSQLPLMWTLPQVFPGSLQSIRKMMHE